MASSSRCGDVAGSVETAAPAVAIAPVVLIGLEEYDRARTLLNGSTMRRER